jgi:hypothetical protein
MIAVYFLAADFENGSSKNLGIRVGILNKVKGVVKSKSAGSFVWKKLSDASLLYRNETVMTGEDGYASITLDNGNVFEMESNSYLLLDKSNAENLSLLQGALVLRNDGAKGDRRISRNEGAVDVKELMIRLIEPQPLSVFFTHAKSPRTLRMAWSHLGAGSEVSAVQISTQRDFARSGLIEIPTVKNESEINTKLPKGIYYWRVVNKSGTPVSDIGQFTMLEANALQLSAPKGNSTVWDGVVKFQWVAPSADLAAAFSSDSHTLELSRDELFKNIIEKKSIVASDGSVTLKGIPEGNYFWRIRSNFNGIQIVSDPLMFQLDRARFLSLSLESPHPDAYLKNTDFGRLLWKSNAEEADYQIDVQRQDGSLKRTLKAKQNFIALGDLAQGTYVWKVTARKGEFEQISKPSIFHILEKSPVELLYPRMGQQILEKDADRAFDFSWGDSSGAADYRVELSQLKDFSEISGIKETKEARISSASIISNPADQFYFWRVITLQNGKPIGISSTGEFRYGKQFILQAPNLTFPADFGVVSPGLDRKPIRFSWNSAKGASSYEISILESSNAKDISKAPLLRSSTKGLSHEISPLPEGSYVWFVKSLDAEGKLGPASVPRNFKVTYGAPLRAPASKSRQVQ